MNTKFIGNKIIHYKVTDSTNLRAKENYGENEGTVFLADFQKCGRGRLSRIWESSEGDGIYMSILLKPDISTEEISRITPVAGLSVAATLEKYTNNIGIKWPNDIIISGKKVCGILTELSRDNSCIVGIGINLNNKSFEGELANKATSLFMETGIFYQREKLMEEFFAIFEEFYMRFLENGFNDLLTEYKKRCITLGKTVEVITPCEKYKAVALDIDATGALIIERDGKQECVNSGEVSVRGILGYV